MQMIEEMSEGSESHDPMAKLVFRSDSKVLVPSGTPTESTVWVDGYSSTGQNSRLSGLSNLLATEEVKLVEAQLEKGASAVCHFASANLTKTVCPYSLAAVAVALAIALALAVVVDVVAVIAAAVDVAVAAEAAV